GSLIEWSFYYLYNQLSFKYKFTKEINDYGRKTKCS
ncbi:hypothetical protein A5828_001346, partial [Enterococcus faecium]